MAKAFIGTSGWNYKHWHNGKFYPTDLKPRQWLEFFRNVLKPWRSTVVFTVSPVK
jgi:uncharacterized protein YecE (DUF72 family)